MKKIIAFAGSNSTTSINKQLIKYTASQIEGVEVISLQDFEPSMYSADLEKELGTHPKIKELVSLIDQADGIIVSTPEHNSMPPAFFKNILDWLSRTGATYLDGKKYLQDKPVLMMSASPGKGGAQGAQDLVAKMLGHGGGDIVAKFTFRGFYDNFQNNEVVDEQVKAELTAAIGQFLNKLS